MRSLTTGQQTAVAAGNVKCCWLVELQFDSGTLRFTTAGVDVPWGGFTWLRGRTLTVESITESSALEVNGTRITMSGIPTSVLSLALSEPMQGRKAIIRSVWMDDTTGAIVDTPPVELQGNVDIPQIDVASDGTFTVSISVEYDLADFSRPNIRRFTDADHQSRYPGDTFFKFVGTMENRVISFSTADAQR